MSTARAQALAAGLKTYQGSRCKYDHSGERRSTTGACFECERERHRQEHLNNPERRRAQTRRWRAANPERKREHDLKYRLANLERERERGRRHYLANLERQRERSRQKRVANPGAYRAFCASRRAMKLAQQCVCCSAAQIQEIHKQAALCGRFGHVDHVIQLSLGGHDCVKNLQTMIESKHIEKTKIDARLRADSHHRNKLLLNWRRPDGIPTSAPLVTSTVPTTSLAPRSPDARDLAAALRDDRT